MRLSPHWLVVWFSHPVASFVEGGGGGGGMISVRRERGERRGRERVRSLMCWWPAGVMGTCTQPVGWSLDTGNLA